MQTSQCKLLGQYRLGSNGLWSGAASYGLWLVFGWFAFSNCLSLPLHAAESWHLWGLVGYWKFDEDAGNQCQDEVVRVIGGVAESHAGQIQGEVQRPDGLVGRSLGVIDSAGYVDVGSVSGFDPRATGSISVWIRLEEHQPVVGEPIVVGTGSSGYGLTYAKDSVGPTGHRLYGYLAGHYSASPLPLDQWCHVVITFDGRLLVLYLDGRKVGSKQYGGKEISTTGPLVIGKGPFPGQIDELRLYNRALTEQEVRGLHAIDLQSGAPLEDNISLAPQLIHSDGKVIAQLDIRAVRPLLQEGGSIDVRLVHPDTNKTLAARQIQGTPDASTSGDIETQSEFAIDLFTLPGSYEIRISAFSSDGTPQGKTQITEVLAPNLSWMGNKEGYTDQVLPPWTPIQMEETSDGVCVDVWGRRYQLGAMPFARQIETRGEEILAKPIEIVAAASGQPIAWEGRSVRVVEHSPTLLRVAHSSESSDGQLRLEATSTIEYDGMIRTDWSIQSSSSIDLDRLAFQVTLPARYATYHNHAYTSVERPKYQPLFGKLPEEGFAKFYVPFVWIGDDDRGLNWLCESDQNWFNADPQRAIEIHRDGDNVVFRVNLVTEPTKLSPTGRDKLDYTFALMATPVKPIERDGWDFRIVSSPSYGKDYRVMTDHTIAGERDIDRLESLGVKTLLLFNWTDIICYTRPVGHEQELRDLVQACHQRGIQVILYYGSQMAREAPEWPWIGQATAVLPAIRGVDSYRGGPAFNVEMVCNHGSYQDFLVSGIATMIDEYDLDGAYLDGAGGAWYCQNEQHGCGYRKADGSLGKTFSYFATRDTLRRIYTAIKIRKPDGILWVHQSSHMLGPVAAWTDLLWDGEQFGDGKAFPLDSCTLDAYRCEFTGRQLGVPVEFLFYTAFRPQGPNPSPEDWLSSFRQAMGLTQLHGNFATPTGMNDPAVAFSMQDLSSSLWKLGDQFGRKEAEWLPYWKNSQYVTTDTPETYVSLYKHRKNGVLAVIANCGKEDRSVKIQFDMQKLGLPSSPVAMDAIHSKRLMLLGDELSLDLPSLGWTVVWLKPESGL